MPKWSPPKKRPRRITSLVPPSIKEFQWENPYNKEGKVKIFSDELRDGASSRVFLGEMNGKRVAIKHLRGYAPQHAATLVKVYEQFFHLDHPKVVAIHGVCSKSGFVILELCEKIIGDQTIHTLQDLMNMYQNELPLDVKVAALADIAEGIQYLHKSGIIHGDIKPSNVLISEDGDNDFVFKVTDYACAKVTVQQSSRSTTLKQLMTPGYMAPELLPSENLSLLALPPNKATDIYAFAIMAYEVVFAKQAWPNVSMALMASVKQGLRPEIPAESDDTLSNLIRECWLQDSELRPNAATVFQILDAYLNELQNEQEVSPIAEIQDYNEFQVTDTSSAVELDSSEDERQSCTNSTDLQDTELSLTDEDNITVGRQQDQNVSDPPFCAGSSISSNDHDFQMATKEVTPLNSQLNKMKGILKIANFKQFQLEAIELLQTGKDVVIVQPTGSGKSLCYTVPALLNPGKITLVIEPVVAIITNQVLSLRAKGIDAVALGRAAGINKLPNFRRVFKSSDDVPALAFCTPEYLFGTPPDGSYSGSVGQFDVLKSCKNVNLVVIDEAHKIFDRMPSFRPAFDSLKKLQQLSCTLGAMSATLTSKQIKVLKHDFLHGAKCFVLTEGVHRDNLVLQLRRYKRQKQLTYDTDENVNADEDVNDHEVDDDSTCNDESSSSGLLSSWSRTVQTIEKSLNDPLTIMYLDFVRDVEQIVSILQTDKMKVAKYTGQMTLEDRTSAETKFSKGDVPVLVATEAFELGVDNPKVKQVIRIGAPRNLGVLLQEFGRAGRKAGMVAKGFLYFNEYVDDKRLGLWLKSSFDSRTNDDAHEAVKLEVLSSYTKTWQFVYSAYHGKCLAWALSYFYGGAGDAEPPTCFVSNSPLCMICAVSDLICEETVNIKEYLCILLQTVKDLRAADINSVTKTLLIGVMMQTTSKYVCGHKEIVDKTNIPWGSGLTVNNIQITSSAWCKVIYIAVHLSLLTLEFTFRPFESHYEVHRHFSLSSTGEEFLLSPSAIMSVNPHSSIIDQLLASKDTSLQPKRNKQNRAVQVKLRIVKLLEEKKWQQCNTDLLKFIGFFDNNITDDEVCLYFPDVRTLSSATSDPHHLLQCLQLSCTQATTKELEVHLDGRKETFVTNRSYCAGVKVCSGEKCNYAVSNKQKINRCREHPKLALLPTGPCPCHLVYVYPKDTSNDGRRWFIALNTETSGKMHNHMAPSEWKISPKVLSDISNVVSKNTTLTPKDVQKGIGMDYRPMEASLPTANLDRMRAVVKKARREVEKIDNEKVNPFKVIASFPAIKHKIDEQQGNIQDSTLTEVNKLIDTYQLDGDDAHNFTRDRRLAFFQAPFQAFHWSCAEALFVDVDYTGNHYFQYLLNIVCFNNITKRYIACGRALMNHQDGYSIGKALSILSNHVKKFYPSYNMTTAHKEILLDFDEAEANGFRLSFGNDVSNLFRGCSVHSLRSAMRVGKLVNLSSSSLGYQIFVAVVKLIPDNPSREIVKQAFNILAGSEPFTTLAEKLPPPLCNYTIEEVEDTNWTRTQTWIEWWTRPQILKKLCKAYSALDSDDWNELPGTNNPVESINRQSTPENVKSVSLRPLIEHIYLEDRRQATLQVATNAGVTISYAVKKRRRIRRPPKAPEKRSALGIPVVPTGKKAIGL